LMRDEEGVLLVSVVFLFYRMWFMVNSGWWWGEREYRRGEVNVGLADGGVVIGGFVCA